MDINSAVKATRNGAIAAFISAGIAFLFTMIAIFGNADDGSLNVWNDPSVFFDVIIILACGYGILRHSRAAAICIFIYFIVAKMYIGLDTGRIPGFGMALIFLYFYARSIQGAFVYHKIQKVEDQNYKAAPKWTYYIGIPTGILFFAISAFGLLTMTDIYPSTKIVVGSKVSTNNISILTENGIINPNDKIEYFYSEGFTSLLEGGSILIEDRVIAYVQEEGDLLVYELPINEITSVKLIKQGNSLNDSIYEVRTDDKEVWVHLYLSAEDGGDIEFVEALRTKVIEFSNLHEDPPKFKMSDNRP